MRGSLRRVVLGREVKGFGKERVVWSILLVHFVFSYR